MKLTIAQFLTLQEFGYSVEEIREYEGTITQPMPGADGSADRVQGDEPAPAPIIRENTEPQNETKPDPKPEPSPESDTQSMLRELLGIVRRGNINGLGGNVEQQDPAEIVASILAPNK